MWFTEFAPERQQSRRGSRCRLPLHRAKSLMFLPDKPVNILDSVSITTTHDLSRNSPNRLIDEDIIQA
jgi:hypothetical protein